MTYVKNLWYIVRHKWYVGCACWRMGLYWKAIAHDWSKLTLREFGPYARYFYGPVSQDPLVVAEVKSDCKYAWLHHQKRNKHHWQYWVLHQDDGQQLALDMPEQYIREMVADWIGASRAIHGPYRDGEEEPEVFGWYLRNKQNQVMSERTRRRAEELLFGYA